MVWFGKNRRRACERHALGKECLLPRKTASFKTVLTIGVIIGIAVIVIAVIAIHLQQKRTLKASIEGTLPRMEEKTGWQALIADGEGEHHYIIEKRQGGPDQGAGAWERLTYSKEGREAYILKRRKNGMFITGMDTLARRFTLYNLRCDKEPRQYAIIKVFEVSEDGRTLDYGKAGSQKDWEDIPAGTIVDRLAKIACP
ncbi:MAG: hypothetical protein A4E60_02197 [Syntrophorhabdus sp. PtaB.Bin047]|jgi:hypothetical protein|nr:MAG: hypothetical protein A4E60_02197 [Syntrophorhabdus sp. PtaB.Bin047]